MKRIIELALMLALAPQLGAAQGTIDNYRAKNFTAPPAGTGLIDMVRSNNFEVPKVGVGVPAFSNDFKKKQNPAYEDPNGKPPPNLTQQQLNTLLNKMVKAEVSKLPPGAQAEDLSLTEEDVRRLIANLVIIDSNYVDTIPASVWDKAIEDMGAVAEKEFDPAKKNWEATVTAMLKDATSKILDPFSVYWNKKEYKQFNDQMNNSFVGIGVILKQDGTINIVIPGGPADKAGIKAGDKIVNVDGTPVNSSKEIVEKTLGEEGTTVKIQVERGGKVVNPFVFKRGRVTTNNLLSKMIGTDVAYVYLSQFSQDSDKELLAAVSRLRKKGAKKLILDVRGNPGGTVDSVSQILSEFMKDGERIVSFKRQGQIMWENVTDGDGKFLDMPLVVLVNAGSASASEILAGALQDSRGPVVVGSQSYGKGSMQTIMPDKQGRSLKLTIGRWYTPRDRSIDAKYDPETREKIKNSGGVIPDHLIVLTEEEEREVMKNLYREVQGAAPEGTPVDDKVLQKGLELLAR